MRYKAVTRTVTETAQILGISRSTAYEAVRSGEIPSLTFGRRIVVPISALEELTGTSIHNHENQSTHQLKEIN